MSCELVLVATTRSMGNPSNLFYKVKHVFVDIKIFVIHKMMIN